MARQTPAKGVNLFQAINALIREYRESTGREPLNLSLGDPDGIPDERIRELKARYACDANREFHTYAEDKNLLGFAQGMVELHSGIKVQNYSHLKTVPIAGIKTAS